MHGTKWHIGCSGFHYKEWKEAFYPPKMPQRNWFDFYAKHFNTLELNVSFYRFPTITMLQNWRNKAPEHFSFSAKVPRAITHFKKFCGTETMLSDFYETLQQGLQSTLACVLFQLPPQMHYSEALLQQILGQLKPGFNNVIEFRNETWWRSNVMEAIFNAGASFSGVSFPKILFDDAVTGFPLCYYRFHGVPKLFYSEYSTDFLDKIYGQIAGSPTPQTVFIYFNNTASTAALHNARYFQQLATGN